METERELDDLYFDLWDESYNKLVVVVSDEDDDEADISADSFGSICGSYRRIDDL